MSLVTTMAMTSWGSGAWRGIQTGANLLGTHLDLARQHALLNECLTALVVANETDGSQRSFTILKKTETGWVPLTRWQTLPEGVSLDAEKEAEFFNLPASTYTDMAMPAIPFAGTTLQPGTGYQARFFYANGQVFGNNPTTLRVNWRADRQTDTGTARFMDVVLIPFSGKIKYTSS